VAETPGGVILEFRQLADEDGEDVLDEIGRIGFLQTGPARPVEQQRGVKLDELVPAGPRISRLTETLQETRRRHGHSAGLRGDGLMIVLILRCRIRRCQEMDHLVIQTHPDAAVIPGTLAG